MPIRRKRLPAPAKRWLNHRLNWLAGWKRSQLHASSAINHRARLLPALLMPCSTSLVPLAYRRRREAQAACDFQAVVKLPPAEQFLDQCPRTSGADTR